MKKNKTLLIAIAGLLIGLTAIVGTATLSGCAVPKKIVTSERTDIVAAVKDSSSTAITAGGVAEADSYKHSVLDSAGIRTTIELCFAELSPEMIAAGIKAPPLKSAIQIVEKAKVSHRDDSGERVRDSVSVQVVADRVSSDVVDVKRDVTVDEQPAKDPYRWRYIFWTVGILAVVAGGWWVKRRFF